MKRLVPILIAVVAIALVAIFATQNLGSARASLRIVSGSENEALEPIILDWA